MKKKKQPTPAPSSPNSRAKTGISQPQETTSATPKIVEYPDPQECKDKAKTVFKEYFVGGDMNGAMLSIEELVGAARDHEDNGCVDRGAAVIETGVLLVLEMKQQDVQKFLAVIKRCLQQKKIESASVTLGLNDPLEFLSDIEIDAPLARSLLTSIVAYWVRQEVLPFNFLLAAPECFLTDGKPAEFAAGVLKVRGDKVTDEDLAVVEKLMTDKDKEKYSSAKEMVAPQSE
jgi:MA3 domain